VDAAPDLQVVGEAVDGGQAVALAERLRPDVVVMDVRMPRVDGLTATRLLAAAHPTGGPAVLVVTTYDLDDYVFGALRAGAAGFLLKDCEPAELTSAIRTVAAGHGIVSPVVTRRLIAAFARLQPQISVDPRLAMLTSREAEVLAEVARGASNADIGRTLHIEESTVKTHVARLLAKLDLRSRAQLVVFAYDQGIVGPRGDLPAGGA
jgi:DNA-binding NarL/FixJ family response regulator